MHLQAAWLEACFSHTHTEIGLLHLFTSPSAAQKDARRSRAELPLRPLKQGASTHRLYRHVGERCFGTTKLRERLCRRGGGPL